MMRCGFLLVLVFSAGACGWFESEEERQTAPRGPRLVGRVASVHGDDGFVLVQGFDDFKLGDGLLLTTRGEEDRAASLVVTGERSGRYTAADLRGGEVEAGDAVFARPNPVEEEKEEAAVPNPSVTDP